MKTINLLGVEGAGSTFAPYSLVCLLSAHFKEHKNHFLSFLHVVDTNFSGINLSVDLSLYLKGLKKRAPFLSRASAYCFP